MDLDGIELEEIEKITQDRYLTLLKMVRLVIRELLGMRSEIQELKDSIDNSRQS